MGCMETREGVTRNFALKYQWERSDAGRATSRRPKQKNDCTVRALALAVEIPYDEAYDLLAAAGRKCTKGFDFKTWAKTATVNERTFRWIPFQAVKGSMRMNPASFCDLRPVGRYVIRTAKHVSTVIDGVLHDISPERPDRCIYGAWEVLQASHHLTSKLSASTKSIVRQSTKEGCE